MSTGLESIRTDVARLRRSLDAVGLWTGNPGRVHQIDPLASMEAEFITIRSALANFDKHINAIEREAAENAERLRSMAKELADAGWKPKKENA